MNKVIIVGASSGIGKSLAEVFSKNGYTVGVTGRRIELLKDLQNRLSNKSYVKQMDLLNPDEAINAFEELVKEMNGVDIVVINSGVGHESEHLEFSKERPAIDVNVLGFTAMAVTATNYFEKKGQGHLVGISSIAGLRPFRTAPAYGASKAFMSFYLKGLRYKFEKQKQKIFVTDIKPGFVDTPLTSGKDRMFWVASSEKAALQIYDAIIKKKEIAYITKRWWIVAWCMRLVPDFIYKRI